MKLLLKAREKDEAATLVQLSGFFIAHPETTKATSYSLRRKSKK